MSKKNEVQVVQRADAIAEENRQQGWLTGFFSAVRSAARMDGWSNIITGAGRASHDARMAQMVEWRKLPEADIENLYAGDAMATVLVDQPVDDALQNGYEWSGISVEEAKRLKIRLEELRFNAVIEKAAKHARLYGGSAILKAYDDALILDEEPTPGRKLIKALVCFQRFELYSTWEDVNKDMLSPDFGCPVLYTFTGRGNTEAYAGNVKIHATRLVRFDGAHLPEQLYKANGYWHDSVLSKPYDALVGYTYAHDSINATLKDLSVAVFKVKGLADMVSGGDDTTIINRFRVVNLMKSNLRSVALDADGEDFDYKVRNLTGVAELVDRAEGRLASEARIPRSILLGETPAGGGLGEKGEHSLTNWYKAVEAYRDTKLKPKMLEIAREVCDELGINAAELGVDFNPLWEESEGEIVAKRKTQAETDAIYEGMGVITGAEIRESRFGGDTYSIETKAEGELEVVPPQDPATLPPGNRQPGQVPPRGRAPGAEG